MAHFHYGHTGAAPIEKLFADALEDGERKSAGAGVEIEDALDGAIRGSTGAHDG